MLCKDKNKNGGFSDLDYLHEIDDDEENLQRGGGGLACSEKGDVGTVGLRALASSSAIASKRLFSPCMSSVTDGLVVSLTNLYILSTTCGYNILFPYLEIRLQT
jgi:hypothetical protein